MRGCLHLRIDPDFPQLSLHRIASGRRQMGDTPHDSSPPRVPVTYRTLVQLITRFVTGQINLGASSIAYQVGFAHENGNRPAGCHVWALDATLTRGSVRTSFCVL